MTVALQSRVCGSSATRSLATTGAATRSVGTVAVLRPDAEGDRVFDSQTTNVESAV